MARLDSLFCELPAKEASDLHMVVGLPIKLRIHGNLEVYREAPLKAGGNDIRLESTGASGPNIDSLTIERK